MDNVREEHYPILPDTAVTTLPRYWKRPMVPWDLEAMDPAQAAPLILGYPLTHSVTILCEEAPLCVGGLIPVAETEALIFLFRHSAVGLAAHAVPVAKLMYREWQAWTAPPQGYRRVTCQANLADPAIDRLLRWLGFRPTGVLSDSPHGYLLVGYVWDREGRANDVHRA